MLEKNQLPITQKYTFHNEREFYRHKRRKETAVKSRRYRLKITFAKRIWAYRKKRQNG